MLITLLAMIVVLGVLIFVHELGHFMTAKAVDIEVPRFSIGFGPKILGFRRGETEYVISLLPFGGYVKMAGMEEMEAIEGGEATITEMVEHRREDAPRHAPRPRDFEAKPLWARALVISAGVLMNLLFAFVVFTVSAMIWGVARDPGPSIAAVTEELLPEGAAALATIPPGAVVTRIGEEEVSTWRELQRALLTARAGDTEFVFQGGQRVTVALPSADSLRGNLINAIQPAIAPILGAVLPGAPGERAGLQPGDRILTANGEPVQTWQQFVGVIEQHSQRPLALEVERAGQRVALTVTPEPRAGEEPPVGRIGAELATPRRPAGPITAVQRGAVQTWDMVALTVDFLGGMITGRHSARNVGGPIMIAQMSGQFARLGWEAFLGFMAVLSVNLAVLNLLPIPVLDGGHLVFLGIEGARGRPLSIEQRMRLTQLGFIVLIGIMVWAIGNDLMRWFGICRGAGAGAGGAPSARFWGRLRRGLRGAPSARPRWGQGKKGGGEPIGSPPLLSGPPPRRRRSPAPRRRRRPRGAAGAPQSAPQAHPGPEPQPGVLKSTPAAPPSPPRAAAPPSRRSSAAAARVPPS